MVKTFEITRKTSGRTDVLDITPDIEENLRRSGVADGVVVVFVPGSTGAVTTIEHEPGALSDLREAIRRLAPEEMPYDHDAAWGDGNGYSHVRAALLGPSVSIPVTGGKLALGTWQQVVLLDFDNRPRTRRVIQQVLGEA